MPISFLLIVMLHCATSKGAGASLLKDSVDEGEIPVRHLQITKKYHEGNMKRILKRELKEPALAEQKANRSVSLGGIVVLVFAFMC